MSPQQVLHDVALRVLALETPSLVGVDGPDGAGKTTFADALAAIVAEAGREAVRASVDDFHQPRAHRHAGGRTPRTVWSRHFDHEALRRELLDPWRTGPGAAYRSRWHDLATDLPVRAPTKLVPEGAVLLVDGLFLHRDELVEVWDLTVYLDVPDDVAIGRVIALDGGLDDPSRYVGAQQLYRSLCTPQEGADIVIDNTDPGAPMSSARSSGQTMHEHHRTSGGRVRPRAARGTVMTDTTTAPTGAAQTHTVGAGTATVTYDVHGDLTAATHDRPVLLLIGSPMDAVGFTTLRTHFTDRPVVTYDPRGAGRNPTDTTSITADEHAEDLHRVIEDLGVGPVDVFASSGGAVNVLALVAAHPADVRRVVAHEPPTAALLPDREEALAVCRDMRATYDAHGSGPAMAKFISFVMHDGLVPEDYLDRPAPDPAMFGLPSEDDGSRTDPLMRNIPDCNVYEPDLDALAVLGDRLVLAVGVESGQQLAARGGRSVAEALGLPVTEFPSNHGGFLGGEYGQQGDPDAFAAALHQVLD